MVQKKSIDLDYGQRLNFIMAFKGITPSDIQKSHRISRMYIEGIISGKDGRPPTEEMNEEIKAAINVGPEEGKLLDDARAEKRQETSRENKEGIRSAVDASGSVKDTALASIDSDLSVIPKFVTGRRSSLAYMIMLFSKLMPKLNDAIGTERLDRISRGLDLPVQAEIETIENLVRSEKEDSGLVNRFKNFLEVAESALDEWVRLFGDLTKAYRKIRNLTGEKLGKLVGLSSMAISELENKPFCRLGTIIDSAQKLSRVFALEGEEAEHYLAAAGIRMRDDVRDFISQRPPRPDKPDRQKTMIAAKPLLAPDFSDAILAEPGPEARNRLETLPEIAVEPAPSGDLPLSSGAMIGGGSVPGANCFPQTKDFGQRDLTQETSPDPGSACEHSVQPTEAVLPDLINPVLATLGLFLKSRRSERTEKLEALSETQELMIEQGKCEDLCLIARYIRIYVKNPWDQKAAAEITSLLEPLAIKVDLSDKTPEERRDIFLALLPNLP